MSYLGDHPADAKDANGYGNRPTFDLRVRARTTLTGRLDAAPGISSHPGGLREGLIMDRRDSDSDEALLAATPRDPEAFGVFYRRHENAMLVFFLRHTADAETAADWTAEVFAAALVSAGRFRPGKAPAVAWLYAIANHKLSSSRRRGRVEDRARRRLRMEPLLLDDEALERVEALADAARAAEVLGRLLAELPPDQHAAVRAHVLEDRDYADIAQELACSTAVVRQRVSRGLSTLRAQITEDSP